MQESQDITVVLVDDHAIVREGIAALCSASGMSILGQCSDGAAAVEMIAALQPDFAILDLNMPAPDGFEFLKTVRARFPYMRILVISGYLDGALLEAATLLGAIATLAKPVEAKTLLAKVREVIGTPRRDS